MRSYESLKQKGLNTNFLTWTALRSSIINMKSKIPCSIPTAGNLDPMNFDYKSKSFNAYTARCKQFYSTMVSSKARTPNGLKKLTADFGLSNAQEVFSIPYLVASETYVWSFQYRVLNFILFRNDKLFKIGLSDWDKSVLFVEPIRKICTTSSSTAPLCKPFGTYLQFGGLILVANI